MNIIKHSGEPSPPTFLGNGLHAQAGLSSTLLRVMCVLKVSTQINLACILHMHDLMCCLLLVHLQLLTFLQHLFNYFSGSPKRLAGLRATAALLQEALWAIQSAGDTRWLANREALDSVLKSLGPLFARLDDVGMRQNESEASSLFGELTEVETILSMLMAGPLLDLLGRLCKILQVRGTGTASKDCLFVPCAGTQISMACIPNQFPRVVDVLNAKSGCE